MVTHIFHLSHLTNDSSTGPLASVSSSIDVPPLTSTRVVLSVSNSPIEAILSLKKQKKKTGPPKSRVFSSSSEFSLPYAQPTKRKMREQDKRRSKRTKKSNDDVFM